MNCLHCGEPILTGEPGVPINDGRDRMHKECVFRTVAGSATHVRRRCAFYGGVEDCHACEAGMTKREAARAAYRAYTERHAALN